MEEGKESTASLPGLQITVAFWESVLENESVGYREQRRMKMDKEKLLKKKARKS